MEEDGRRGTRVEMEEGRGRQGDPWVLAFKGLGSVHIFEYNTARRSQALAPSLSLSLSLPPPPFPLSSAPSLSFFRFPHLLHVLCQQILIQRRVVPLLRRFQQLPHEERRHGEAQVLDGCHQSVRRAEQVHWHSLPCTVCTDFIAAHRVAVYRVP